MDFENKASKTPVNEFLPRELPPYDEIHDAAEPPPVKDPWDPAIRKHILQMIGEIGGGRPFDDADMVSEMIVTSLKAVEARLQRGDLKILNRALRELRYAFKVFKAYKGTKKVSIFGSARTPATDESYGMAEEFAAKLNASGYMVITGAGPGIMEAGNKGAGPGGSFGVNIRLPFEQFPNKYIAGQPTFINCRFFFTRKLLFVKEAGAAAFFPGGFGTLDEAFELLTLIQTGKCDPIPLIFMDTPGNSFWKDVDDLVKRTLLKNNKISEEDLSFYKITDSVEEATGEILRFYSNYHSLRFVGDKVAMRFLRPVSQSQLNHLNSEFKDILTDGEYRAGAPLKAEANEPELSELPRLIFKFNRINNGRLRQLIDFMNRQ